MIKNVSQTALNRISDMQDTLTPKGKLLADYILHNHRKAVFMTTRDLAGECGVSEATVVRFVSQLGYGGYGDFLQSLRDHVDTALTLSDRINLSDISGAHSDKLSRTLFEEMDNLQLFHETANREVLGIVIDYLRQDRPVYVVGSRLSFAFSYYLGWSLTKIRQNVHMLRGSDTTAIDFLSIAPSDSIVIIITVSRYPNELLRLGKAVRRSGQTLLVITDSELCPLNQFAHHFLVAPSKHIPLIGSPTTITAIINYLIMELAASNGEQLAAHQEKLEQAYRENDILFNIEM